MNVNALRVVTHRRRTDGQLAFLPLKGDSLKFICVAAVVAMALDLLESRASFRALCEERELAQEFPASIRASIPHVVVSQENGMGTKNGRTNKLDCPSLFDPKRVAVLELNDKLLTMLVDACDNARVQKSLVTLARFQSLLCRISITFAHELVHVYTLFLRRERSQHTPPHLTYGGYGDKAAGEAGRFWEFNVFGGYVDMRAGPQMEAMALRGNSAGRVWRLRSQLIERLIARDFSWLNEPLTEPDHPTHRQATEPMDAYKWIQKYADIFPEELSRQNSIQELSNSQLRELVELENTQFPAYCIRGSDLRAFSRDPTVKVHVS
ncbi:hypothetical protein S40288_05367 [Stachybotrys chartarum IBT 40288]|nr:hypothetical protein S40288_05367 [Stachybotrys chartarum IBT 40288]